jgi:hypothetical protein
MKIEVKRTKENGWSQVFVEMAPTVEQGHDRLVQLYEEGQLSIWEVTEFELQSDGGKCNNCGKLWVKRRVDNIYVNFTYYEPNCTCYPVCPFCGKVLIREVEEKLECCGGCRHMETCLLFVETKETSRTGKTKTKRHRCGGKYAFLPGGKYVCDECGKIKGFERRDDLILPKVYR